MLYDANIEPGHQELFESVTHVDLAEYQPGHPRYERLQEAMEMAQKYSWPSTLEVNV